MKSKSKISTEDIDYMKCLESSHIPNEETLESIKNIEKRKKLIEINELNELIKKI